MVASSCSQLVGVLVFAYYTGSVSTLLAALSNENARILQRRQAVAEFCRAHKIPRLLAERVRAFYNYVSVHEVSLSEPAWEAR